MDIQKLMEQAQAMQQNLGKIQEELNATIYEGVSGSDEGVKVKVNGANEVQEVLISEELMNPDDREMLQDMILIAVNNAVEKAAADREDKLGVMASGMNIPGL